MKKRFLLLVLILFVVSAVFGISLKSKDEVHSFDSLPMLEKYYDQTLATGQESFWDECSISLVTIGEGGPLYSWFGHSALLVQTPENPAYVFDYGSFSFDAQNFYTNFAMGRLWFCCSVSYASYELSYLEQSGRTYSLVELNLSAAQKKAIISFLTTNAKQENRTYLYHHYNDNCATRLRDIINKATDGNFETWAKAQEGLSFRKRASAALSNNRFIQWALEFLQSGQIDKKATVWDEMFLPAILEKAVVEYGLETGLVSKDGIIGDDILIQANNTVKTTSSIEPKPNTMYSLLLGASLALVAFVLLWTSKRGLYKVYAFSVNLVFGLMGTLLLFMMVFTNHNVTWYNENILFINPILIIVAVKSFMLKDISNSKAKRLSIWYKTLLAIIGILIILKMFFSSIFIQDNWNVILTIAPFYVVNAFLLGKRH